MPELFRLARELFARFRPPRKPGDGELVFVIVARRTTDPTLALSLDVERVCVDRSRRWGVLASQKPYDSFDGMFEDGRRHLVLLFMRGSDCFSSEEAAREAIADGAARPAFVPSLTEASCGAGDAGD